MVVTSTAAVLLLQVVFFVGLVLVIFILFYATKVFVLLRKVIRVTRLRPAAATHSNVGRTSDVRLD